MRHLKAVLTGAATACLILTAVPAHAAESPSPSPSPSVGGTAGEHVLDLGRAHLATLKYTDEAAAVRDGYVADTVCAADPEGSGAMGYHYVKESLIGSVDPTKPAALVYGTEKGPDGKRKLLALEWLVPDEDQDLTTAGDRPELFGLGFDGPMPGHSPGMPVHYDLHAWAYEPNPSGYFKPWNPNVTCPPGSTTPPTTPPASP
ncbi:hypothetical protein [Streptomyces sp. NPDC097619]|uniref:hypothetical protein n=1 Tax=Streptomyces sp. NPDC097619 TaxID=3157228 RepID=UPI0033265414